MAPNSNHFNDEHWDENQWEAHIDEIDRKRIQLRKFIASNVDPETPRWVEILQQSSSEYDAVDSFIEEELALEEAYFPDQEEEDDWDEEDMEDWDDDFFLTNDFEDLEMDEPFDDFGDGDEWKELSSEYAMSDEGSIENLGIYRQAHNISVGILKWMNSLRAKSRSIGHNQFVHQTLQIGAKIAAGYSFGFDTNLVGGNLAYNKKALNLANNALALLQRIKEAPSTDNEYYFYFHEQLFNLRNDIGVYVQELRYLHENGRY